MQRFTVTPGQRIVPVSEDCALVYDGTPNVVRLPPELGGGEVRVLHGVHKPCPCRGDHDALVLVLDEPTGIMVAECRTRGYLWFRVRK